MKKFVSFFLFLLIFHFSATNVEAGLVTINKEGKVIVNVLSYSDKLSLEISEKSELDISKVANEPSEEGDTLSLYKEGERISLKIIGEDEIKNLDITGWENEIVEIEEREDSSKLRILLVDGKFAIEQNGFVATTEYPIDVDAKNNNLSLITPTGSVHLSILPLGAAETLLKSKTLTTVTDASLVEKEAGKLVYEISGEREINLFNIFKYSVPVSAQISVLTGEILFVDQPVWLKAISILLS